MSILLGNESLAAINRRGSAKSVDFAKKLRYNISKYKDGLVDSQTL